MLVYVKLCPVLTTIIDNTVVIDILNEIVQINFPNIFWDILPICMLINVKYPGIINISIIPKTLYKLIFFVLLPSFIS